MDTTSEHEARNYNPGVTAAMQSCTGDPCNKHPQGCDEWTHVSRLHEVRVVSSSGLLVMQALYMSNAVTSTNASKINTAAAPSLEHKALAPLPSDNPPACVYETSAEAVADSYFQLGGSFFTRCTTARMTTSDRCSQQTYRLCVHWHVACAAEE